MELSYWFLSFKGILAQPSSTNKGQENQMKINAEQVFKLRLKNSWTQEELSIASGLSLKTVQRIEKKATASLQSKKALAAVFAIDVKT